MPTGAHTCASPAPSGRGPAGLGRSPASHSCCHTRPQPPPRIGTSNTFGQRLKTCHKGFCRMHAPWKRFISPVFTSHARTLLKSLLVQRAGPRGQPPPLRPPPRCSERSPTGRGCAGSRCPALSVAAAGRRALSRERGVRIHGVRDETACPGERARHPSRNEARWRFVSSRPSVPLAWRGPENRAAGRGGGRQRAGLAPPTAFWSFLGTQPLRSARIPELLSFFVFLL